jgi:hypothetical protein
MDYLTMIGLMPELPKKFAFGCAKSWNSYHHFDVPFQTVNMLYMLHFERRSGNWPFSSWAQNVKVRLFGGQFSKQNHHKLFRSDQTDAVCFRSWPF